MSAAVKRRRAKQQSSGANGVEPPIGHEKPEPQVDGRPQQHSSKTQLTSDNDTNCANANGMTPLMRAAGDGLVDFVQVLLDRGADVNAKRNDGFAALALAAFFGHSQVVRLLLERGADVKATTRLGTSAEMWADARGFIEIGDLLRETRESKPAQEPAPLPAVLQEHPRFSRPMTEDGREEVGIVQERHQDVDAETTLETNPVKALAVEEGSDGKSTVSSDHVVSVNTEHFATQTVVQRAPRAGKILPETLDPPPIIVPEFHPGSVFVARIGSSWKNLTALTLAVTIVSGLTTFAVFKMSGALTRQRREPAKVTSELPAKSNDSVAQPEQRIPEQADNPTLPSAPVDAPNNHAANVIEASTPDSNRIEATNKLESDEGRQTTSPSTAKNGKSDSGTQPTFANRISESPSSRHDFLAPTRFRSSSSYQKRGPVAAKAIPKPEAVGEVAPKPAPLSVESTRDRTTSSAAERASESPNSQSTPLGVTSDKPRSKVIQWP